MNNKNRNFIKECKINGEIKAREFHRAYSTISSFMWTITASFFCFVCLVFVFNNLALLMFYLTENMESLRLVSYWWLGLETLIQKTFQDTQKKPRIPREKHSYSIIMLTSPASVNLIISSITACLTLEINIYFTFLSLTLKMHFNE